MPRKCLIDSSVCDMTPDELYAVQTVFRNVLDAILACENVQFCYDRDTISGTPLRIIYDEKEKAFSILLKCGDEANTYDMSKITDFRSGESFVSGLRLCLMQKN